MARFLKHTACPVCSSSDALAHYDDGSTYCFSHGRSTKSASLSPYVAALQQQDAEENFGKTMSLPSDAVQSYSVQAVAWAAKYEISVPELLSNQVYFSGARNQLIFAFLDGEGTVLAWQARNLSPLSKAKRYYTQGDINGILPIYFTNRSSSKHDLVSNTISGVGDGDASQRSRCLVLVEDCLSAIKVASLADAGRDSMPLLGSGITRQKLARLRPFYDVLDVFLDPDMWPKSLLIAKQAEMLGFKTRSIRADCDPKELTREGLTALLA